jgi:hypothetical protein
MIYTLVLKRDPAAVRSPPIACASAMVTGWLGKTCPSR